MNGKRLGVTRLLMVIVIVVIIAIAGVGIYYLVFSSNSGSTIMTQSSTQESAATSSSLTYSASAQASATSSSGKSSTAASGIITYGGTFNFSQPIGPSGVRVLSNNTVQTYGSTQVGSGSFTFFISSVNKSGSGTGHGTLTVTTSGFCSGTVTIPYTFTIPDATTLLGNLTIFFGKPTPANFTVSLSCYGPMTGVDTSTNNPSPYLSVFPNEISVATTPATVAHLSGNITYSITIT